MLKRPYRPKGISYSTDIHSHILPLLQSHSHITRLNALHLISLACSSIAEPNTLLCITTCTQAEQVPLDIQSVRDRVLKLNRIGLSVSDGDNTGADVIARWLIGQLKINLKPLWIPACTSLQILSSRFPKIVWSLLFSELSSPVPQVPTPSPEWAREGEAEEDVVNEEEHTWRDPSAHKMRIVVSKWMMESNATTRRAIVKVRLPFSWSSCIRLISRTGPNYVS